MSDLRQRLAAVDPCCTTTHVDAALAVFADWLREHAKGARFAIENMPEDEDPNSVALWGGARAVLNALAHHIDRKGWDSAKPS